MLSPPAIPWKGEPSSVRCQYEQGSPNCPPPLTNGGGVGSSISDGLSGHSPPLPGRQTWRTDMMRDLTRSLRWTAAQMGGVNR